MSSTTEQQSMAEEADVTVDGVPAGYLLVKNDDGIFSFHKMDDDDAATNEVVLCVNGDDMDDLSVQLTEDPLEENVCEEEEFLDDNVSDGLEDQWQSIKKPQLWRGVYIPSHLNEEQVSTFKAKHQLGLLAEQVTANRQKVKMYTDKVENIKVLIANQRSKMMKNGFHTKDMARFLTLSKKTKPPSPEPPSPEADQEFLTEIDRIDYEKTKLTATYKILRKRLKTVLSSYRRYKKHLVENDEKIKMGPEAVSRKAIEDDEADSDDSDEDENGDKAYKCYHCKFGSSTKRELREHMASHFLLMKFACPTCPYVADKITRFLDHMKKHPEVKAFSCQYCTFKSAYPSAVRNHEATHLDVKPYKCPECDFKSARSDHLRSHMRRHGDERPFKCPYCSFASKYNSGLSKHKKTRHRINWELSKRGKKNNASSPQKVLSAASDEMVETKSDEPGETTVLEIDEKGKMLQMRSIVRARRVKPAGGSDGTSTRKVTENEVGDQNEDFEDFGEETVYELRSLEEEEDEEVEGENSEDEIVEEQSQPEKDQAGPYVIYQCVFCSRSFETKDSLVEHMSLHMKHWSFSCNHCDFVAVSPTDLRTHGEEHKFEGTCCSYCDFSADNREELRRHVKKKHPSGKPLVCAHCPFICVKRPSMKAHMTEHRAKKEWSCFVCDYTATYRSSLLRHMKKHTGERPYRCKHCDFNASQYSHLNRHLRRLHPDIPVSKEPRPPSPLAII